MLTSKQRAYLRGQASVMDTILQIGKGGISDTLLTTVSDALEARELIKVKVLENAEYSAREAADLVAEELKADVVQVIGTKFVLYRQSSKEKNRKYDLRAI